MNNAFKGALKNGEFVVTCEMIPGRGAFEQSQETEYLKMKEIFETGRVQAISITDNPGGNPAISAPAIARRFLRDGVSTLVHYTCKDRSRNLMQSELYELQADDIENLLVMTGDYQASGFGGASKPVFDLDCINALRLVGAMNDGMVYNTHKGEIQESPANFFAGAVVNPFKYREGEIIPQYVKLEKKLIAGAQFVITQLGYDARKMQELLMYVNERGYKVPMIANVFLLSKAAAQLMQQGTIAGCYISDELVRHVDEESKININQPGYAHTKRIERAAKMIAIAKGMGYAGVHIGGFGLDASTVVEILDLADELEPAWRKHAKEISYGKQDGCYLYQPELDEQGNPTGLNLQKLANVNENINKRKLFSRYGISRFFHKLLLSQSYDESGAIVERGGINPLLASSMESREKKKGTHRSHRFEHTCKAFMYGCIDCGDCGLEAVAYSCPMASCPKSQRNGPCGGSMDGYCEVYPPTSKDGAHFCIHYMAYHRLKRYGELHKYTSFITPPNDWSYWQHSAWSNYTHGRDNASKRICINNEPEQVSGTKKEENSGA